MKKSNRFLLTLLIALFAVPSIVHLALMARYKRGAISVEKFDMNANFNHYEISAPHYVSAAGLHNLTVVSSDSASLAIEKSAGDKIEFSRKGDSLIIRSTAAEKVDENGEREGRDEAVTLHLPSAQGLVFDNCNIKLVGAGTKEKGQSFSLTISDSRLGFGSAYEAAPETSFDNLEIHANGKSSVKFFSSTFVRSLFVELAGASRLEDQGLKTEKLKGSFAPGTSAALSGENLNKLNKD